MSSSDENDKNDLSMEELPAKDPDSSSSSESDSDSDIAVTKINELKELIKSSPFSYDPYVELIELLRKSGELDELREIREAMNTIFPLTAKLWLDWVKDEQRLATTQAEKEAVTTLFERAVKDYLSISLWLEFAQFTMGYLGQRDGENRVRDVFERSLMVGGFHVSEGALLWEAYREFEKALLLSKKPNDMETISEAEMKELEKQNERIISLFKRQLTIPLFDMESTFKEYQEWIGDETKVDNNVLLSYNKALAKLEKIKPFEEELLASEPPPIEAYFRYLEEEKKDGDPSRIQCIYERAVAHHCLNSDLWLQYTNYLDKYLKIDTILLPVHERAVRNCPWTVNLWIGYIRAMERHSQPVDKIRGLIDRALQAGLTHPEEIQQVWLSYLDFLRRRVTRWQGDQNPELEELRDAFQRSLDHLKSFEASVKPANNTSVLTSILKYWAFLEAKYCKNMAKSRELWSEVLYGHGAEAQVWLEYSQLERAFGDVKHCRKVLLRGLNSATDWPEAVGEALLLLEREEGTLESYDTALEKYQFHMKRIHEKREKDAAKEAEKKATLKELKKQAKQEKKAAAGSQAKKIVSPKKEAPFPTKRKLEKMDWATDAEGFKVPFIPAAKKLKEEVKNLDAQNAKEASKEPIKAEHPEHEQQEIQGRQDDEAAPIKEYDPLRDERSVFLSNLDYNVSEDKIKEVFKEIGEIVSLRIVKDYKGRSKGFAYLEFSSKPMAKEALKKDRSLIDGRPLYVSPCRDKNHSPNENKFMYKVGIEKEKLFVKNIPIEMTQSEFEEFFKKFGEYKEARLSLHRNGFSKGIAYVEYHSEEAAAEALSKANDYEIGNKKLIVMISNPPPKKQDSKFQKKFSTFKDNVTRKPEGPILGGGARSHGPRGKARSNIFVPRVLQKTTPNSKAANGTQ